ncbi:MAG: phosphoribosylglycinamide formyltransferase [Spirochaetales bacterium]|nr:phosphoribosylglycinamide formyltransferase [Spirochaetales bacterium]MDY5915874.1 phosphoribosylglycinamide formyltransferase [Treponema sp.]
MKSKVAVLVSGGGTNLQTLIDYEAEHKVDCPYEIVVVISDHKDAFALERAQKAGIPTAITSPFSVMGKDVAQNATRDEKRLAVSNAMLDHCQKFGAQIIVEAGCLTVLSGDILKKYANRIINLHPALLPKFGGVGMWGHHVHEAVLAAGETESGCTVHLVNEVCDGGEILLQKKVPVLPDDTPETLYARIAPKEHEALLEGLLLLCNRL